MNTIECIKSRRSIRKYVENKPVSKEQIEIIIESAMYAPTARNLRPWHFIIIDDRELLIKLSEVHPHGKMMAKATLGILVCGDVDIEPSKEYNAINCSAATQNILLAIHELGLGAVWLGVFPREERMKGISETLKLPEKAIPISLISIGHPDEFVETPQRVEKDKIHYNKW